MLKKSEPIEEALKQGASSFGVILKEKQTEQLLKYITLLNKWNQHFNLTAFRELNRLLSHQVLDSLSILSWVKGARHILDVGSGGGAPGLPLAVLLPEAEFTLLDASSKKTTFLLQAKMELALDNVQVVHSRVENTNHPQFQIILSRAFADLSDFVHLSVHLLAPGGMWLAMKGTDPYEEIKALPPEISVEKVETLHVPGVKAERHIVRLRPHTLKGVKG